MTAINPGPASSVSAAALQVTYDTGSNTLLANGAPVILLQVQFNDLANNFAGTVQFRRPTIRIVQNPYT
jgi:hypothetical protein